MSKISCNVIQDIMPLYVDEIVSEDTKKLVEEHLKECEDCRKEMEKNAGKNKYCRIRKNQSGRKRTVSEIKTQIDQP